MVAGLNTLLMQVQGLGFGYSCVNFLLDNDFSYNRNSLRNDTWSSTGIITSLIPRSMFNDSSNLYDTFCIIDHEVEVDVEMSHTSALC